MWTLTADLKQFAERYETETSNHVKVVVYDSADFQSKIMQTLGGKSKDVDLFVGEPQMLPLRRHRRSAHARGVGRPQ